MSTIRLEYFKFMFFAKVCISFAFMQITNFKLDIDNHFFNDRWLDLVYDNMFMFNQKQIKRFLQYLQMCFQ